MLVHINKKGKRDDLMDNSLRIFNYNVKLLLHWGVFTALEEQLEELAFLKSVKKKLQTDCIRYTGLRGQTVKKVAVCGGAGSFLLNQAIAAQADVFITADFKYHEFFDAEGKIVIADVGHFESEQFTKDLIVQQICEKFPTFAALLSKINTNPIKYL